MRHKPTSPTTGLELHGARNFNLEAWLEKSSISWSSARKFKLITLNIEKSLNVIFWLELNSLKFVKDILILNEL